MYSDRKMEMTMPVPKKYELQPNGKSTLTSMSFYMAEANPPTATNGEITLETWTNKKIYVR